MIDDPELMETTESHGSVPDVRERDAAARERLGLETEVAQLKKEKDPLAEEVNSLEEAKGQAQTVSDGKDKTPKESTESQRKAHKDLKATVDAQRRKHKRGRRLWRTLSVVSLHLISLLLGFAIFLWKSNVLHSTSQSYRDHVPFGLFLLALIFLLLLLEYMRNWQNYKRTLTKLDKIAVDLTASDSDLSTIRTNLKTVLDEHDNNFLQRSL